MAAARTLDDLREKQREALRLLEARIGELERSEIRPPEAIHVEALNRDQIESFD